MFLQGCQYERYEDQYYHILKEIKEKGFRQKNERTGYDTLRIPHAIIQVDLQREFPILKCKKVLWKSALHEILWIMQKQSNNIKDLKPHIWDEWADENGSIGKAYGYQIGRKVVTPEGEKYKSQVHYVLGRLSKNSSDRRCVLDTWSVGDMRSMNLVPCVYTSMWTVIDNKLNCMIGQRSADFLVGVPFNTTQYAILTHLFARHLGVEVGQLTHVMSDCHVYCCKSHMDGMDTMLNRLKHLYGYGIPDPDDSVDMRAIEIGDKVPMFYVDSDNTNFFKVNPDDCEVENYHHFPHIPFEVVV